MYIVYETTNLIDGKYYIGVHCGNNPKYLGSGKRLKLAINKYGIENFMRETLREFSVEQDAYEYERLIVDEILVENNNCYNIVLGGGNPPSQKGKNVSLKTRNKLSDARKKGIPNMLGKIHSEETKRKMSISAKRGEAHHLYGKHLSEDHKEKISDANKGIKNHMYGKHFSSDHIEKLIQSHQIYIYYIDDNIFSNISEAGEYFNVHPTTISRWCKSSNKPNCYRVLKDTI